LVGERWARVRVRRRTPAERGGSRWRCVEPRVVDASVEEVHDFGLRRDLEDVVEVEDAADQAPLGAGSYGIVRMATDGSGKEFALKSIPKRPRRPTAKLEPYLEKLRLEVAIMKRLGASLNVVYLYDAFEDTTHIHLLMELMRGGELWGRIKGGEYGEREAAGLMRGVMRTVAQLHTKGVIYRDVKPENFLFETDALDAPLKATDFGLATNFEAGEKFTRLCGTPAYMAPELIQRDYGPEVDCWAAGVVAYQLLTGRLPFQGRAKPGVRQDAKMTMQAVLDNDADFKCAPWPTISKIGREFVEALLERDPKKRLTAKQALAHPWLSEEMVPDIPNAPLEGQVISRLQRYATSGLLKRSVMRRMVNEFTMDGSEVEELQAIFRSFDVDQSGFLTPEEMWEGVNRAGFDITLEEIKQVFSRVDTDGNERINCNEWVAALYDWQTLATCNRSLPELAEAVFRELDNNADGKIDADEIARLVCSADETVDSSVACSIAVTQCIKEADRDGDGQVNLSEFLSLLDAQNEDELFVYESRVRKQTKAA